MSRRIRSGVRFPIMLEPLRWQLGTATRNKGEIRVKFTYRVIVGEAYIVETVAR